MRISHLDQKFVKALCVKSKCATDFQPEIEKGKWYECLLEETKNGSHWIKVGNGGLCLYDKEYFKTQSQIRDEELQELLRYFM